MTKTLFVSAGFTLVEVAIVIIIIGLVISGILVGNDLIKAANIRATIAQVDKFKSAVNTFRVKYNGLPGDLLDPEKFGLFGMLSGSSGLGDGNGLIQGFPSGIPCVMPCADYAVYGETILFWRHLSEANLIPGKFRSGVVAAPGAPAAGNLSTQPEIASLLPQSKVGSHSFFRIVDRKDYKNYFMLYGIDLIWGADGSSSTSNGSGLTPFEAYSIDAKIDDGHALSGSAKAAGYNIWIDPGSALDPSVAATPTAGSCVTPASLAAEYAIVPPDVANTAACGLHFPLR